MDRLACSTNYSLRPILKVCYIYRISGLRKLTNGEEYN